MEDPPFKSKNHSEVSDGVRWHEMDPRDAACVFPCGYHPGAAWTPREQAEHIHRQAEKFLVSTSSLSCSIFCAAVANAHGKLMRQRHQMCFQMSEDSKEPLNHCS